MSLWGIGIRVANWNVMWRFASPEERLPLVLEHLRNVGADAVALQECSPDQVSTLAAALGMDFHYAGAPLGRGGTEMGNAVLVRGVIEERTHRWLPMVKAEDMRRVAVAVKIRFADSSVWVVSVHLTRTPNAGEVALDLSEPESRDVASRLAQIADLRAFTDELDAAAVVAGDWALLPDSAEYRAVAEAGFVDSWRAQPRLGSRVTTPSDCPYLAKEMTRYRQVARDRGVELDDPGFCLDYQFLPDDRLHAGLAWTFGRPADAGEMWPSDHLGVCVDYVPAGS